MNFLDDSEQAFNYLFLLNHNNSDYSIYTKNQFYYQVRHSVDQVSQKSVFICRQIANQNDKSEKYAKKLRLKSC